MEKDFLLSQNLPQQFHILPHVQKRQTTTHTHTHTHKQEETRALELSLSLSCLSVSEPLSTPNTQSQQPVTPPAPRTRFHAQNRHLKKKKKKKSFSEALSQNLPQQVHILPHVQKGHKRRRHTHTHKQEETRALSLYLLSVCVREPLSTPNTQSQQPVAPPDPRTRFHAQAGNRPSTILTGPQASWHRRPSTTRPLPGVSLAPAPPG